MENKKCPFCEELAKTKDVCKYYKRKNDRSVTVYNAALVTDTYTEDMEYRTGRMVGNVMDLIFCPVCGKRLASKCSPEKEVEFLKKYSWELKKFINCLSAKGLDKIICTSFEEAENNDRRKNIVIIADEDGADLYLTYKYAGNFGEFGSWVSEDFEEDELLFSVLGSSVVTLYSYTEEEIDALIASDKFNYEFTPYDDLEQ